MARIKFTLHGDIPESGCIYIVHQDQNNLQLLDLENLFPFEGSFHFRYKSNVDNAWIDIVPNEYIRFSDEELEVQVLVLSIPDYEDEKVYDSYLDDVRNALNEEGLLGDARMERVIVGSNAKGADFIKDNQGRFGVHSQQHHNSKDRNKQLSGNDAITLETVTKTASNIWKTVKSTASTIQQNIKQFSSQLSDTSEENLSELSDDLSTIFIDSNPRHMNILNNLWNGLFPNVPFQRSSTSWKEAGFQNNDPVTDLKSSGILALKTMTYLCEKYVENAQSMLSANKLNKKSNYPFAVVGINITLMLAEILGLKHQKYFSIQSSYWELFENKNSFYEIFCVCFFYLDKLWTSRNAVRGDFGKLMMEVKSGISGALSRSPRTISDLHAIAAQMGM